MKPALSLIRFVAVLFLACMAEKGHADILTASDGQTGDWFGQSVSVSGDTVVVGANRKNGHKGGAYIYHYDGGNWNETILSAPDDVRSYENFGKSVSVSGDTAIVGSASRMDIYIYQDDGSDWNKTILSASDVQQIDHFGSSVSVSGGTAIVGAYGKDGSQHGGAYIYRYDGSKWNETILSASDGQEGDYFGYSVSVSGDTAIVGAHGKDSWRGGIYIYQYDGSNWNDTILTASDGQANDHFGYSVSVSGDTAIVGANGKRNSQGGAYIYQYDGSKWNETILSASDGQLGDSFGYSSSISGNNAIVGAYYKNSQQGGAYIYQYDGSNWNEVILSASGGKANDQFGYSVSLDPDGDRFAIGGGNSEKVYTNTVGALTTFDKGLRMETIDGINFKSQMDWVVGGDASGNMLTLSNGTADISAAGKSVYVGQNAGSNGNILIIEDTIIANAVHIGSVDGNVNNMFVLGDHADWTQLAAIYLAEGNMLVFTDEFWASPEQVLNYLGSTELYVFYEGSDVLITADNYMDLLEIGSLLDVQPSSEFMDLVGGDEYGTGTYVMLKSSDPVIPEPTTSTLWLAAVGLLALRRRK